MGEWDPESLASLTSTSLELSSSGAAFSCYSWTLNFHSLDRHHFAWFCSLQSTPGANHLQPIL